MNRPGRRRCAERAATVLAGALIVLVGIGAGRPVAARMPASPVPVRTVSLQIPKPPAQSASPQLRELAAPGGAMVSDTRLARAAAGDLPPPKPSFGANTRPGVVLWDEIRIRPGDVAVGQISITVTSGNR